MKRQRLLSAAILATIVAAVFALPVLALQTEPPAPPTILEAILSVFLQFATLAGVGALLAALVNVGKAIGIVTDGTAGRWFAGLSLAAIGILVYLKLFQPGIALEFVDAQAAVLAQILLLVLGYVVQLGAGLTSHTIFAKLRLPAIGKTFQPESK